MMKQVTGLPRRTSHAVCLHENLLQVLPDWQCQGVLRSRLQVSSDFCRIVSSLISGLLTETRTTSQISKNSCWQLTSPRGEVQKKNCNGHLGGDRSKKLISVQDVRCGWERGDRSAGNGQDCCLNIQDDGGRAGDRETSVMKTVFVFRLLLWRKEVPKKEHLPYLR